MDSRITLDEYFIQIVKLVAQRSTCLRRKVGAILVKDGIILSTGYNGSPRGIKNCLEIGCLRQQKNIPSGERVELCSGVHAEQNAIIQVALKNTNPSGSVLYCTTFPCVICAKILINSGIKKIVYVEDYNDMLSASLLNQAGIPCMKYTLSK